MYGKGSKMHEGNRFCIIKALLHGMMKNHKCGSAFLRVPESVSHADTICGYDVDMTCKDVNI